MNHTVDTTGHAQSHARPDRDLRAIAWTAGATVFVVGAVLLGWVLSANHPDSPVVGPGAVDKVKYGLEVGPLILIAAALVTWLGLWLDRRAHVD